MTIAKPINRDVYACSGRVRVTSLLGGAVMATLAGLLVSALMAFCSYIGFYLLILVPIAAGLLSGGLAMLVVRQSHCRSPAIASVLGAWIGLVAYLGHYHFDMLQFIGLDQWYRVDALPSYIQLRWTVDTVGKVGRQNNAPPLYWMNVIISLIEFGIMAGMSATLAGGAARRPYSEQAGCWMTSHSANCVSGSGAAIIDALNRRAVIDLEAAIQPMVSDEGGYCQLDFWMCPLDRDPERDEPMLVTISEYGPANKDGNRKSVKVIDNWVVDPGEVVVFAKQLPSLVSWLRGADDTAAAVVPA